MAQEGTLGWEKFFDAIFPAAARGFIELRALPGGIQHFVRLDDWADIVRFVEEHKEKNLFFGVATRREPGDGSLSNCADVWALWCDIDFKTTPEAEARRLLAAFKFPPSIIIQSGHGLHVYWLLRHVIEVPGRKGQLVSVLSGLARALGGDLSAAEPARILRVPETLNRKYDPARPVTVERFEPGRLYEFADIERALPVEPERDAKSSSFSMPSRLPEGTRNDYLYRLARSLHFKGLSHAAVLAALRKENALKSEPPLADDELERIADHAVTQPDRPGFRSAPENGPIRADNQNTADGPVLVNLGTVRPEPITYLWPGRIVRGKLNLIMGDPGLGKSLVTLEIAARVSTGREWPGGGQAPQGHVILLTAEDGLADTVRPRIDALGGDASNVTALQAIRERGLERGFNLARDLPALERAIAETEAIEVTIDPLSAYLGYKDSYRDSEVRGVLAPLAALAARTDVAIVAVMHLTKNAQRAALYRAQGSIAFVASARSVLAIAKDPDDEGRRLLLPIKLNIAAPPPVLAFRHAGMGLAWEPDPVVGVDVEAVLRGGEDPEEGVARRDAVDFLRDLLSDGEVSAQECVKAGEANGISPRTLKRAKAMIQVKSTKRGSGVDTAWYWSLPGTETREEDQTQTDGPLDTETREEGQTQTDGPLDRSD